MGSGLALPERPPRSKNRKKKNHCNGCGSNSDSEDDIYRKSSAAAGSGAVQEFPVDDGDHVALLPVDCVNEANRVPYYDNEFYQPEPETEPLDDEPEVEALLFRNSAAAGIDSILTEMEHEILLTGSHASGIHPSAPEFLTGTHRANGVASGAGHPLPDYLHHDRLIAEMSKLDWDASGATCSSPGLTASGGCAPAPGVNRKPEPKIGGLTIQEFIHFLALLERVKEEHLDPKRPLPLHCATAGQMAAEMGRSSPYDNMANRIRSHAAISPTSGGSSSGDSDSGDEYQLNAEPGQVGSTSGSHHRNLIPDGVAVLEQLFRRRYLHVIPEEAGSDASSRISRALSDLSGSEDPASPLPADLSARLASALHDFPRSPSKSGSASGPNIFFPQMLHDLRTRSPEKLKAKPEAHPEAQPEAQPEVDPEAGPEVTEIDESLLPVSVVMIQAASGHESPEHCDSLPEILILTVETPSPTSGICRDLEESQLRKDGPNPPEADPPEADPAEADPLGQTHQPPPEEAPRPHPSADAIAQTEAGVAQDGAEGEPPSDCHSPRQMAQAAAPPAHAALGSQVGSIGSQPIRRLESIPNPESAPPADGNRTDSSGTEDLADESRDAAGGGGATSCATDTHPASAHVTGIFRAELIVIGSPSLSPEDNFKDNSQVDSQVDFQVDSQVNSQVNSKVNSEIDFEVDSQVSCQVDSKVDSQVDSETEPEGEMEEEMEGDMEGEGGRVEGADDGEDAADDPARKKEDGMETEEELSHPDAVSTPKLKPDAGRLIEPPEVKMIPHRNSPEMRMMPYRSSPEETGYSTDNGPERPSLPCYSNFRFQSPPGGGSEVYFHPPIPPLPPLHPLHPPRAPYPPHPPHPPHRRAYTFQGNPEFRNAEEEEGEEEERLKATLLADWLQLAHSGNRKRADLDRSSYSTISSTTLCSDSRNASAQESESESESADYWRGIPEFRRVRMSHDRNGYSSGPELRTYGFYYHPHPPEWSSRKLDYDLNALWASGAEENYGESFLPPSLPLPVAHPAG